MKRYDLFYAESAESSNGQYVLYSDIQEALKETDKVISEKFLFMIQKTYELHNISKWNDLSVEEQLEFIGQQLGLINSSDQIWFYHDEEK